MKILINDTADIVVRRKRDGHRFLSAEGQLSSITSTLGISERILGGIGNKTLAIMKGQKEVTTTFRNAMYDAEFLAMTQGVEVEQGKEATVYKREDALTVENGSVTIQGTPANNEVIVRNPVGAVVESVYEDGVVMVPEEHAKDGDVVSVTYQVTVTGEVIELDAEKFGEAFEVEYHTIGYNPDTMEVVKDIYIQLDHVVPQGEMELSLENGTALAPEFTFDALTAPNTSQIGRIIHVNRESDSTP